jgi:hypothetical protein
MVWKPFFAEPRVPADPPEFHIKPLTVLPTDVVNAVDWGVASE